VGTWKFNPHDGTAKVTIAINFLDPGGPVRMQREVGLTQHYEIRSPHKMIVGGSGGLEAYVQFGAVVNGIATSANLLYKSEDGTCTYQDVFTRTTP
jgi:hypothetical protein